MLIATASVPVDVRRPNAPSTSGTLREGSTTSSSSVGVEDHPGRAIDTDLGVARTVVRIPYMYACCWLTRRRRRRCSYRTAAAAGAVTVFTDLTAAWGTPFIHFYSSCSVAVQFKQSVLESTLYFKRQSPHAKMVISSTGTAVGILPVDVDSSGVGIMYSTDR